MVDNSKEVRKQILSCIGSIAAAITIVTYLILAINSTWTFIDGTSFIYNVLMVIRTWAPLVVVGITGLEFVSTKNLVVRIVFYVAIALVVVFLCLPNAWSDFVGVVNKI